VAKESEKARELLSGGKLDAKALGDLARSPDGQAVRALLGDEEKLRRAAENGDAETLNKALQTLLKSPEGQRLFRQLGGMMGKK